MNRPNDATYDDRDVIPVKVPTTITVSPEPVVDSASLRTEDDEANVPEIVEARAQIAETRAHMSETIDAIKDKLSPATLLEEAKDSASEAAMEFKDAAVEKAGEIVHNVVEKAKDVAATASDMFHNAADYVAGKTTPLVESTGRQLTPAVDAAKSAFDTAKHMGTSAKGAGGTIVDTIRMNPIPAALIAIGIGWLLAGPRRKSSVGESYRDLYNADNDTVRVDNDLLSDASVYQTAGTESRGNGLTGTVKNAGDAVTGFATDAKEKVADLASNAQQKASELASAAKQQANTLATTTREKTQETVSFVDQWVHEEPLAAGAIALLVGAAVGLALPGTRKENELFGAKRDELAQRATETAQEMADKVQTVAQNSLRSAKDAIGTATDQVKADFKQEAQSQGFVPAS